MDTRAPGAARLLVPGARPARRLVLVLPAGVLLLIGIDAGLLLMGVPVPLVTDRLPDLHAMILVFGFVGALISLERAVALRAAWAYAAPVLLLTGVVLALTRLPVIVGQGLVVVGMAVHVAQYRAVWARQPMTATAVQALGAVAGTVAALVWCAGVAPARLVPLLAVFLVLTIAGERLELARIVGLTPATERTLFVLAAAVCLCVVVGLALASVAVSVAGILLLVIAGWLVRYDIARTMVRRSGQPRFIAACLLAGYGWLAFAGAGWFLGGARSEGPIYDATTHAVFLGFVITLIMAHAPLILPAVLQVRIPYHPLLYVPVALLQLALLLRVVAGDAWGWMPGLRAGGIGAAIAMILFAVSVVTLSVRAGRAARRSSHPRAPHRRKETRR